MKVTPLGGDGPHAICIIIIEKDIERKTAGRTDRRRQRVEVRLSLIEKKGRQQRERK